MRKSYEHVQKSVTNNVFFIYHRSEHKTAHYLAVQAIPAHVKFWAEGFGAVTCM